MVNSGRVDVLGSWPGRFVGSDLSARLGSLLGLLNCAVVLQVPAGKNYVLKPVRFSGPCKSNLTVEMSGNIAASDDRSDYKEDNRHWLTFDGVDNLLVEGGGGKINGNGNIWWQNSCKINITLPCTDAPTPIIMVSYHMVRNFFWLFTYVVCNEFMIEDRKDGRCPGKDIEAQTPRKIVECRNEEEATDHGTACGNADTCT
ncbi:hypothetical protein F3Y22_tig00111303pilonHSYRG00009 [Hibiscus syriacus]|uniref:Polygalacturonase n=1 Tax=Hibiscus syriacus TaxID=106335 RepID=A0A6A2YR78_HIBSY|nr:hypothetical protein F3Y22_tig00111303pilonHSYRG00009 [Hibiscus syriacus]